MYRYEKKESKIKRFLETIMLIVVVSAISIFSYKMYLDINIDGDSGETENASTAIRLSVEKEEEKEISNTLEDATKCVVGISKIKNKGELVLEANATKNLSLGTGMIISDNGYIITNWHLAGNKYSSCYVTLENGSVYSGSVVWADSDLDLAIVKISVNRSKLFQIRWFGQYKIRREGICNRKSYRDWISKNSNIRNNKWFK